MKNLKPRRLLPSLREKKHYLVLKTDKSIKEIESSILDFIGVYGFARASPKIISQEKDKIIISVNTKYVSQVKAALAMHGISCVGVSGTINKAKQKFWKK